MTSISTDRLDGLSSSTAIKGPCRVATTANVALYGQQTIDVIAVVEGDRVLVKNQTATSENGIYICDTGQWRRAKDFSRTDDVRKGTQVFVNEGTAFNRTGWMVNSNDPIDIGDDAILFLQNELVDVSQLEAYVTAAAASAAAAAGYAALARNDWIVSNFTGDGFTTNFALASDPGSANNIFVNFQGAEQFNSSFTLIKSLGVSYVSFTEAPPNTLPFEIKYGYANAVNIPALNSVGSAQVIDGSLLYADLQNVSATSRLLGRVTAAAGPMEEITAAVLRDKFLPSGSVIDSVSAFYATNADITTVIPLDDSIPQITEGTQILTVSITPKVAANKLRIRFQGEGSLAAGAAGIVAAIFDGAANALCASYETVDTANYGRRVTVEWEYSPGVVTAKTISVRVGPGAAGTLRMNGYSAARFLGGSSACSLIVEEIKA